MIGSIIAGQPGTKRARARASDKQMTKLAVELLSVLQDHIEHGSVEAEAIEAEAFRRVFGGNE